MLHMKKILNDSCVEVNIVSGKMVETKVGPSDVVKW